MWLGSVEFEEASGVLDLVQMCNLFVLVLVWESWSSVKVGCSSKRFNQ